MPYEEPLSYEEQENLKRAGWTRLIQGATPEEKAHGVLMIIDAHYWRARVDLEAQPKAFQRRVYGRSYSPGHRLDIDVYVRHWLAANGHRIDPVVLATLKTVWGYEPKPSRFLPAGIPAIHCTGGHFCNGAFPFFRLS